VRGLRAWWKALKPGLAPYLLRDGRDDDEVVAREVPKHWVCYTVPTLLVLAGFLCWVAVPFASQQAGWFPILAGIALVALGLFRALQRKLDLFVITDQKVFRVHGVLHRNQASMPLGRILDTTVDKPLVGRVLNFGHFTFESAAQDQGLREIRYVEDIEAVNLKIQEVTRDAGLRGKKRVP
jgi:membrane protein YdbS with pleckstrin-like domain